MYEETGPFDQKLGENTNNSRNTGDPGIRVSKDFMMIMVRNIEKKGTKEV